MQVSCVWRPCVVEVVVCARVSDSGQHRYGCRDDVDVVTQRNRQVRAERITTRNNNIRNTYPLREAV